MKYELCEDEGCPQFGTVHYCSIMEPFNAIVDCAGPPAYWPSVVVDYTPNGQRNPQPYVYTAWLYRPDNWDAVGQTEDYCGVSYCDRFF